MFLVLLVCTAAYVGFELQSTVKQLGDASFHGILNCLPLRIPPGLHIRFHSYVIMCSQFHIFNGELGPLSIGAQLISGGHFCWNKQGQNQFC